MPPRRQSGSAATSRPASRPRCGLSRVCRSGLAQPNTSREILAAGHPLPARSERIGGRVDQPHRTKHTDPESAVELGQAICAGSDREPHPMSSPTGARLVLSGATRSPGRTTKARTTRRSWRALTCFAGIGGGGAATGEATCDSAHQKTSLPQMLLRQGSCRVTARPQSSFANRGRGLGAASNGPRSQAARPDAIISSGTCQFG